jgi:hypothetical protein
MVFKYEPEIARLACDLARFTERIERDAFCWAFSPVTDDRNFVPRAITIKRDECASWALSFFETEQQAKKRMQALMRKNPNIYLKLGTHIASGKLNRENGVSEDCSSDGHFNHHEYDGNDFKQTFTIINSSNT